MKKFLSPKNDFVFKKLFTSDTEILTDLINNALELSGPDRIISVEVKNPAILTDDLALHILELSLIRQQMPAPGVRSSVDLLN